MALITVASLGAYMLGPSVVKALSENDLVTVAPSRKKEEDASGDASSDN